MFPLNSNDQYIDSNGKRSTLGDAIGSGGGGGSTVSITPVLTEGTKIADFEIDGDEGSLYAPAGGGGGGGTEIKYFDITQSCAVSMNTWSHFPFSNSEQLAGKTIIGVTQIGSPSNTNFAIALGQITHVNIQIWVYSTYNSSPANLTLRFFYYDTPTT